MNTSSVGAILADWYAANPRIRRVCAYEMRGEGAGETNGIHVLLDVEPVMDSEEILPVWLVNAEAWLLELQARTARAVHLGSLGPYQAAPGLEAVWLSEGIDG